MHKSFKAALAVSVAALSIYAAQNKAEAASAIIASPNVVTTAGAIQFTFGGQTFVNKGLQGMGRITAGTKDFLGGTFGAFSGMDLDLSAWRKTATGGYTGTLFALPDRGPNGVGTVSFSDYAGRLSQFSIAFTPYTGTADLPAATSSQNQLVLTANGGIVLKDFNGNVTTGLDPGVGAAGIITQGGYTLPGPTTGPAAGKISLDAEAVRFLADKSFYVSDEYGANAYYFDASGNLKGVIKPPAALIPRDAQNQISYTSTADQAIGRRFNQGMEGMGVTPDGKKLVTLLQSATYQDTNGTNQQTRNNTRLMIYDITGTKTPTTPIGDYVLQLPIFNTAGTGAPNRTAAQSELLALNDTQFLVLARDGLGLGLATGNSVYKSVLLVDTTGATNLAGTTYETSYTPIASNGTLVSTIVPLQQVEMVNLLNSTQLNRFGENLNNVTPTRLTLSEKWEGMALAPVLDEAAPQDFFLFVGNDNDFLATNCNVNGQDCSQAVDSDAHVLVYRLTLPTYVDPQYFADLNNGGKVAVELIGQSALGVSSSTSGNTAAQLNTQRRSGVVADGVNAWVQGTYSHDAWEKFTGVGINATGSGFRGTFGADYNLGENFIAGGTISYGQQDGRSKGTGIAADAEGYSFGGYARVLRENFYAQFGVSFGHVDLDKITRPGAYGMTALGKTSGNTRSYFVEAGTTFDLDQFKVGPKMGFYGDTIDIKGYTETGAAGGDIVMPAHNITSSILSFGGEAYGDVGSVSPFLHVSYNWQLGAASRDVTLRLASVQNAMGTSTVTVPSATEDYVELGAGIQGVVEKVVWNVGYAAQLGMDDRISHVVRAGVAMAF